MSKVASYLQEHILGEVTTNPAVLAALGRDLSVLEITPEMAVYPRVTNDIRKIARFTWQLAEKGHVLPLTPRGGGSDETGGAIGKGVSVVMTAHMDRIFEFDAKQKLVRLQPGATAASVNAALVLQGMAVPSFPSSASYSTVGGIVSSGENGPLAGKYGDVGKWVSQLEIILANGDVLQTGRLSKRELGKRKGLQTFEGEIYRNLDNLIDDNAQLIAEKIAFDARDNVGYSAIAQVKQKDGSLDLTPLFVGAQGTLGIISEMIMKTEFVSASTAVAAIAFGSSEAMRDALDHFDVLEPAFVEFYDGELFSIAEARGKKYDFLKNADMTPSAVVVLGFDDFSDRARIKKLKKVEKLVSKMEAYIEATEGEGVDELLALRDVTALVAVPDGRAAAAPPIIDGAYIPRERSEEFLTAAKALVAKHGVVMPFHSRVGENTFYARPILQLHRVGDKQKVFKLLDEYASLVTYFGGHLIGNGSEGRVKARFAYAQLDPDVLALFASIKAIFDPHGTMNPGVKQPTEIRHLIPHLRSSYDTAAIAGYVPRN